ncbi:uncharacterized protein [Drosophila virilis]|uniref:Uncharacterized protein, isoform A n=1 Tax=Drosophila virilis TaxID=7244 RepID=B4LGU2_DROVI|nr:uncharacterized protein LOC6622961 [Drosophila virilis]XP_015030500.1 uncharacterized protein LOC6622961 [Drosophila virilis]EDW70557.1 uncharacterized protein Dvir_GJ11470, isoform A [Drosophila virilis]KRF84992.1 uncharacterized protein Dvir_GJ11470, isoform B [Drosophila virilis]
MMSNTRNNCMNVDENISVAATPGGSATPSTVMPEFVHLTETRRGIYRAIAATNDDSFNNVMNRLLRQFECAIREELECAQNSPLICRKLARSIIGLTDLIYTLQGRRMLGNSSWNPSCDRWCYIVANYIACELCAAQERVEKEQCIIERIGSMLSLYVEDNDTRSAVHKEKTLLTLIAVPKLYGQANIITVFYSRLFPQWSSTSGHFSQAELPDKIYIEYIIIFYYWQRLERDEATKQRIFEFAIKFMRPACTLPYNPAYIEHLPKYRSPSTATRCILEHLSLQKCCRGLHAASKMDNRTLQPTDLILDSDEEDTASESNLALVGVLLSTSTATQLPPPPAPDPPDFLKRLCRNASHLEPVKRATALYRGIDPTCEVVDLCESDDDDEMFSLDFSVPANVDGNGSNSNEAAGVGEDDYVPITRIYPINLRTYQRATSSGATVSTPAATYTMPRIVNSYSCRRDSLHLVSTTQMPPHLVDQCVQTAEQEAEAQHLEQEEQLLQLDINDDAISSCMLYSDSDKELSASTSTPKLHYKASFSRRISTNASNIAEPNDNHYCHQSSSRNSHSSEASLHKKQVTFSVQHLGASNKSQLSKSFKTIKPSIKNYKKFNNTSLSSLTPSSSMDFIESLKWMGRKEHLLAGQRMFSKLESKKICDKRTTESLSSCNRRGRQVKQARPSAAIPNTPTPTSQLTPTTSNASSGTPTPQPKRRQPRGPQRSLPTPPASTHSSVETCQRRRSTDSAQNSIDVDRVQALARKYKFNRRKFADTSTEHVDFYNSLLQLQRRKLDEKRGSGVIKSQSEYDAKLRKRLHTSNTELRKDIERLENEVAIIKSFAAQVHAKKTAMPMPVVRLKRIHIEDSEELARPKDLKLTKRRRRRKQHGWSRIKNVKKKVAQQNIAIWTSSPTPTPTSAIAPATDSVAPATPVDFAVCASPEPDSIAAYVTLATNGESCSEEDAVIKAITTQECTLSREAEPSSVIAAHEIEVASSNVPVYLLNGESRDVMTPVPPSLSSDAATSEP